MDSGDSNSSDLTPQDAQWHLDRNALELRQRAFALLERASKLDGLQPYALAHVQRFSTTIYACWSREEPGREQAEAVLGAYSNLFDEENEGLTVGSLSLESMAGIGDKCRVPDLLPQSAPATLREDVPRA